MEILTMKDNKFRTHLQTYACLYFIAKIIQSCKTQQHFYTSTFLKTQCPLKQQTKLLLAQIPQHQLFSTTLNITFLEEIYSFKSTICYFAYTNISLYENLPYGVTSLEWLIEDASQLTLWNSEHMFYV